MEASHTDEWVVSGSEVRAQGLSGEWLCFLAWSPEQSHSPSLDLIGRETRNGASHLSCGLGKGSAVQGRDERVLGLELGTSNGLGVCHNKIENITWHTFHRTERDNGVKTADSWESLPRLFQS